MKHVVLPGSSDRNLSFYLAMEEYVARTVQEECMFVWRVGPTVIFGRNQDLEAEVNLDYCREKGVLVVRRRSGGGCVYSDKGNIMISFISRRGEASAVFDRFLSALTASLCSLGLSARKSGRNDVTVAGYKVSGNAFQMLPDRSIVHGTLLYSTDLDALEKAVNPPVEKLERHGIASVRQRVMNLSDHARSEGLDHPALQSVEALEDYMIGWFTDGEISLSEDDVRKIEYIEETEIWKKTF